MKRLAAYFAALGRKLLALRDTPHAIAGGVAIGMFIGFTPLFGIKTLLCLGLAYLFRCSPIAAVIAVSLHDVVTPFWPVLLKAEYDIGAWVLGHFQHLPNKLDLHHFRFQEMLEWTTFFSVGLPLLAGSLFLSAPAAVLSYSGMLALLQYREKKTLARAAEKHP
ncbi:MAG: DUF2062 domain-containing protein [Terrimicrobiaceae bacterium]